MTICASLRKPVVFLEVFFRVGETPTPTVKPPSPIFQSKTTFRPHIPPSQALELQLKSTMPHGCGASSVSSWPSFGWKIFPWLGRSFGVEMEGYTKSLNKKSLEDVGKAHVFVLEGLVLEDFQNGWLLRVVLCWFPGEYWCWWCLVADDDDSCCWWFLFLIDVDDDDDDDDYDSWLYIIIHYHHYYIYCYLFLLLSMMMMVILDIVET